MSKDLAATFEVQKEELTRLCKEYITGKGLTDNEVKDFINISQAYQLNPFKREIHVVAYGQGDKRKCSIITGYEVYRKRAELSGDFDGSETETEFSKDGLPFRSTTTVWRKSQTKPTKFTAYFSEFAQYTFKDGKKVLNSVWGGKPIFMLEKVSEANGLRKAFPTELGGMPYTAEEQWEPGVIDRVSGKPEVEQPRSKSEKEAIKEDVKPQTSAPAQSQSKPEAENVIEAEVVKEKQQGTEKPPKPAEADDIELIPSSAINVDPANVIPAIKAFIVGTGTFTTAKGSTATKVIIADSSATRKFEVRLMGDRTADFYKETYYRFYEVKTVVSPEGKVFTCKRYEQVIDME